MQPVDFTTLTAVCSELRSQWLPARLEQVYQRDRYTLHLALRTLSQRGWLTISWHPQAARLCLGTPPPRGTDTFTLSQQLRHQLCGLALVAIEPIADWERVMELQFAQRPQEPAQWRLYVEIMGKYSNVILTNADQLIVTAAHQVNVRQSSVRPIQTGQVYQFPPRLTDPAPTLSESQHHWQQRVALIPGSLKQNLLKTYRGLSSALVFSMIEAAGLDPGQSTDCLSDQQWRQLFHYWQDWLLALEQSTFIPGWRSRGYTVLGWGMTQPAPDLQTLVDDYYRNHLERQAFQQLRHQLLQRITAALAKLRAKADLFTQQLAESDVAEHYRQQADLLMAHLQAWRPGMQQITLSDFITAAPQTIPLNPERNLVQNAQALYKRHQKLKRSRDHLTPLLAAVHQDIQYLEQVEAAVQQIDGSQDVRDDHRAEQDQGAEDRMSVDLLALTEIRDELIQQQYFPAPEHHSFTNLRTTDTRTEFHRYQTPNARELLVGRNNRQNEQLTFRVANAYDLWFHTQEIPGSHVLLRLDPGTAPEAEDLQFAADMAAYFSRSRQSHQVPVVYTKPKHVYKPKGAQPGMVIYKHEQILWGCPQTAKLYLSQFPRSQTSTSGD